MPDRLPPVKRVDLPPTEQPSFDNLANAATSMFGAPESSPFIYKTADGRFVGPFPFFLAAPEAGEYAMGLFSRLARIPGLPADAKEVAILTVGAKYQAQYELYAHVNVAREKVGMEGSVVQAIAKGEKPSGLNEGCSVAFDVARYLTETPGPLSSELWDRSIAALGKEGTVALVVSHMLLAPSKSYSSPMLTSP